MTEDEKLLQAQAALDIAALNGILAITARLKLRSVFDQIDLKHIHSAITKPLNSTDNASNDIVQEQQQIIDDLFAEMLR